MVRFWLPFALILMITFSVFMTLLSWRPYDNSAFGNLLPMPADCPAPCWGGIRPGVTDSGGAIDLLQQHDWVAEIDIKPSTPPDGGQLIWYWAKPVAPMIDETRPGVAGIHRGIVTWIQIPTTLALGDLWLAQGEPTMAVTRESVPSHNLVRHYMMYGEQSVQWRSAITCPWRLQNFWLARLDLWLGTASMVEMPPYRRPTHTTCRNG